MKPVVKSDKKIEKKSSNGWLSVAVICLLASGTFGAKLLLLVDNDLELKTKFAGKSWQLDKQSLRKYADDFDRFIADDLIKPIGASLQQESTQLLNRANTALSEPQNWCIPTSDLAGIFNQTNNSTATKTPTTATNKNDKNRIAKDFCITNSEQHK
jgi:hypothetical protein